MNQIDNIMAQAQVFASAWALAGGRFDSGDGFEIAEQEKQALRAAIEQALAVQPKQELVEWVDLTPKEVRELFEDGLWIAPSWTIYQEISAKLREKNGGTK